ncbi:MAG: flagellar filament capping protein FliD [Deltaproteobacteria bacterium]|nr:flagellar filament capping protein FliD [Deltaproteobacteria bacterium]
MALVSFSGLASGIDSDALIEATSDATRAGRVVPYEKQVAELEDTNTSLEELTTKLISLQSTIRGFASMNGGPIAKQATSSNESVLAATASNAAINSSYNVTVNQMARNGVYSFSTSDQATYPWNSYSSVINGAIIPGAPAADRTVTIDIGNGSETIDIVLSNTTTLSNFVNEFNATATMATASIINLGSASAPQYQIMISSHNEGVDEGIINVSRGSELQLKHLFGSASDPDSYYAEQVAQNAEFTIEGIDGTITRQSNTVSDLITGVTFQLNSVSATAVKVTVSTDADTTAETVQGFVDAYNEIIEYLAENNLIERKEEKGKVTIEFSPLAKTRVDDSILSALRTQIASTKADNPTAVAIFADLGITTERNGNLKFNSATFKKALADEPESVKEIMQKFADAVSLTGGTIDQFVRFNGLIDVTITANKTSITNLNERIARAEELIAKQAETMKKRFTNLEMIMGRMQSQQQSLISVLGLDGRN